MGIAREIGKHLVKQSTMDSNALLSVLLPALAGGGLGYATSDEGNGLRDALIGALAGGGAGYGYQQAGGLEGLKGLLDGGETPVEAGGGEAPAQAEGSNLLAGAGLGAGLGGVTGGAVGRRVGQVGAFRAAERAGAAKRDRTQKLSDKAMSRARAAAGDLNSGRRPWSEVTPAQAAAFDLAEAERRFRGEGGTEQHVQKNLARAKREKFWGTRALNSTDRARRLRPPLADAYRPSVEAVKNKGRRGGSIGALLGMLGGGLSGAAGASAADE